MRTRSVVPALIAAAVVLTGCRIDVGTEVAFDRGGAGEVAVSVRIDGATLRELDLAGVDPGADVALGLGEGTAWRERRSIDADGGLVLSYRRSFTDGDGATALLRELWADVDPQDPAVRLDVVVATTTSGAVTLTGSGALIAPATTGVRIDGLPAGPVGEGLAALVADAVRAQLVVRVPGRVVEHDADVLADGTLRWTLPVGEPRPITLVAEALPPWRRVPTSVTLALAVLLVAGAGVGLRMRRRGTADRTADMAAGGAAGGTGVSPAG